MILPFQNFIFSQENVLPKKKTYKVTVYDSYSQSHKGYLHNIADSSVSLASAPTHFGETGKGKLIQYPDISSITIQRKGSAARGVIYGAVGGFLIGVIIGIASGDDPVTPPEEDFLGLSGLFTYTAGEKAIGGGILLAGAGAAVGGITGALIKKKFTINGKKENFDAMRMQTLEKIYTPSKH
jgi:hypothetical protein